jgi:hypothetical protein
MNKLHIVSNWSLVVVWLPGCIYIVVACLLSILCTCLFTGSGGDRKRRGGGQLLSNQVGQLIGQLVHQSILLQWIHSTGIQLAFQCVKGDLWVFPVFKNRTIIRASKARTFNL